MQIEIRGDRVIIDGYVNAVGRDSRPIRCQTGDFVEQVEPGVFRKALSRAKNVDLLLNHRPDRKLGSTEDGVLTLTEDNIGLRAHAEIGNEEAIDKARKKLLRGWSFGMYVNKDNMEQRSNAIPRRHLEDIDIFEVSLIDNTMMPYYAGTSVECRAEGDALAETRAFDDTVEVNEVLPDDYYSEREKQLEQLRAVSQWCDAEKRLQELRYNPYHDPTNGRFTSGSGGNGGYLFVGKGQKGKGQYVFDRDIDAEYEEYKDSDGKLKKSNANSISYLKEQISKNETKINKLSEENTTIYQSVNSWDNENPMWGVWRKNNKEINELKRKNSEMSIELGKLKKEVDNSTAHTFINGFGEATHREITSLSYKNSQSRLDKQIKSMFGMSTRATNESAFDEYG